MFKVRPVKSEDINLIYATWLRSYKHESPLTKYIKRELFFKQHQSILDKLLSRKEVKVLIACDVEEEDLVLGYLAHEPDMIHFIYVKEPFRNMGIAKQLLEGIEQKQISHLTYTLLDMWTAGKTKIEYNPYCLGVL